MVRRSQPARRRPGFRPLVQELEDRRLLAAPTINPIAVPLNLPAGKTLIVPITADAGGNPVTYTVTSDNPQVQVIPHPNNTFLDVSVAGFGTMEFELFNDLAPYTASLIAGFAQAHFYDNLTFHRVYKGFMIQGGDPAGNGSGGPGFSYADEFSPQSIFSGSGQLALANSGNDTDGSQFFITDGPQRFLDFNYTLFGQLVRGFDVLHAIESVPVTQQSPTNPENSKPVTPVVITGVRIVQDTSDAVFTLADNDNGASGGATLTVTATSSGGSTTTHIPVQVMPDGVDDPPVLGPVSDQVAPAGSAATFQLTAVDLQPADALTFGAVVLQGNATASADASGKVTVTPGQGFTGSVQVLVGVMKQGATGRGSNTTYPWNTQVITVAFGDQPLTLGAAGPVTATEGAGGSLTLATLTDAGGTSNPADYQVSINWGDGTRVDTTTGQVTVNNGQLSVSGTHTYREAGSYPVRVVVTDVQQSTTGGDNGGATAKLTLTATVADAALSSQPVAVSGTAGSGLGLVPVATFTDANPDASAGDFAAQINWGDGVITAGTVVASGGGFQVLGSHVYGAAGQYPVSVAVADLASAAVMASTTNTMTTAAIAAPPPPPVVLPPVPVPQPAPVLPPPPPGKHRHRPAHAKKPKKPVVKKPTHHAKKHK
jgi:cyclophilin family peptidyl-prolyl cis-trans isomerase